MSDKATTANTPKTAAKPAPTPASRPLRSTDSAAATVSNSGLDISGQFRIGDTITLSVHGGDLMLTKSGSGEQVVVGEAALAGLLYDEYFLTRAK